LNESFDLKKESYYWGQIHYYGHTQIVVKISSGFNRTRLVQLDVTMVSFTNLWPNPSALATQKMEEMLHIYWSMDRIKEH